MLMKQTPGIRVAEPKSKGEAWAIRVGDAEWWEDFEREVAGMDFDAFKARLTSEKMAGLVAAQALIERWAPKMAGFLKNSPDDAWNSPLLLPEWRDTAKKRDDIRAKIVKGDAPVMLGRLPVHPKDFKIDPTQKHKADAAVEAWKADLKRHGVEEYESGSATIPTMLPVCPIVEATFRCALLLVPLSTHFGLSLSVVVLPAVQRFWSGSERCPRDSC